MIDGHLDVVLPNAQQHLAGVGGRHAYDAGEQLDHIRRRFERHPVCFSLTVVKLNGALRWITCDVNYQNI